MTRTSRTTGVAARRVAAAGALVVLAGLMAACGGSGDDGTEAEGEPSSSESAGEESPEATDEAEETEAPEETTAPKDLEPTPPDTVLEPDEPAIVEVVYTSSGRGLYELELVSVEEEPLSSLPPDVPAEEGSTLYYVTQDWTMLDRGTGNVQGMNLKAQTSVSVQQDFQILPVLFAETPGCEPAQFRPEDGTSGKTRRHCSAYLLPPGDQLKQVWFYEVNSPYDFSTGGAPVRWRVDV